MAELATIARPYAEAVFRVAQTHGQIAQWAQLLDGLALAVQTPELQALMGDPKNERSQIIDLLISIVPCDAVLVDQAKRFLDELVGYRHVLALSEIATLYQNLCNAANQVQEVTIYSAYPISESELVQLMPALEKRFGKSLKPQIKIDKTLIGGICAVVGDETMDLSIKARLKQMKAALMS